MVSTQQFISHFPLTLSLLWPWLSRARGELLLQHLEHLLLTSVLPLLLPALFPPLPVVFPTLSDL